MNTKTPADASEKELDDARKKVTARRKDKNMEVFIQKSLPTIVQINYRKESDMVNWLLKICH